MLELDIIEESDSGWSSPIIMVSKEIKPMDCVDFRKLNSVTGKKCLSIAIQIFNVRVILVFRILKVLTGKDSRKDPAFIIPGKGLFQL